jgi:hypothetical protein
MKKARSLSVLVILFVSYSIYAQQELDAAAVERQRKILALTESIIAETKGLRLPENRASVFAGLGNRIWEIDRKRSQELFRDAVAELIAAQADAESDRRQGRQTELVTGQSSRPTVLRAIANRDAEFALKSFYQTRPAAIERAMANGSARDGKIRGMPGSEAYLIQNELGLEQILLKQAADQNPEKAVALLQNAIKKGITGEALPLLQKLHEKNPAAASEMASEVVGQLMRKSFVVNGQPDYNSMQAAFSFLNEHIRSRSAADNGFRFATADMRSLMDKLVGFFLEKGNQYGYPYSFQIVQVAEKMRPDVVEKLKEVERLAPRRGLSPFSDPNYSRLMNAETPIEQILAEAPKLPVELRRQAYQQTANRLMGAGDAARARQIINDNFSDEALANAKESLNWQQVHQLINNGKFAEAEALIEEFPDPNNRFSALVSLADAAYSRNIAENKNMAMGILSKAASYLPDRPENNNEMQQAMRLAAAYTRIEPAEAFRTIEGLVPYLNELTEASVVVNGFNNTHNIRKGETVMSAGGSFNYVDGSVIRGLGQKDLERTLALVGSFTRREMRVGFLQLLLESL